MCLHACLSFRAKSFIVWAWRLPDDNGIQKGTVEDELNIGFHQPTAHNTVDLTGDDDTEEEKEEEVAKGNTEDNLDQGLYDTEEEEEEEQDDEEEKDDSKPHGFPDYKHCLRCKHRFKNTKKNFARRNSRCCVDCMAIIHENDRLGLGEGWEFCKQCKHYINPEEKEGKLCAICSSLNALFCADRKVTNKDIEEEGEKYCTICDTHKSKAEFIIVEARWGKKVEHEICNKCRENYGQTYAEAERTKADNEKLEIFAAQGYKCTGPTEYNDAHGHEGCIAAATLELLVKHWKEGKKNAKRLLCSMLHEHHPIPALKKKCISQCKNAKERAEERKEGETEMICVSCHNAETVHRKDYKNSNNKIPKEKRAEYIEEARAKRRAERERAQSVAGSTNETRRTENESARAAAGTSADPIVLDD